MSKIEWTGKTWNPTTGCHEVSPGCKNCYARTMHQRLHAMGQAKYSEPFHTVRFHPDSLDAPLRRRKPTTYFVNSMSDLFHKDVSNEQIAAVFGVMAACPQDTFQILTKRAERLPEWFGWIDYETKRQRDPTGAVTCAYHAHRLGRCYGFTGYETPWPLPNVQLLVSCEDQQRADERIPLLLQTPAAVRGVSLEPLLGPMTIEPFLYSYSKRPSSVHTRLDWVIVGGESGPGARPCDVAWIRSIVKQCKVAGVACFVKQLGANYVDAPNGVGGARARSECSTIRNLAHPKGGDPSEWPADLRVREMPDRGPNP